MIKKKKTALQAKKHLHSYVDSSKQDFYPRFFKTGPGEYGEGDQFIGVTVPNIRSTAKEFFDLPLSEVTKLLKSKIHEERLLALILMVNQFKKADDATQTKIYNKYISSFKYINNWDLVDLSACYIVGPYLQNRDKRILSQWAKSDDLWTKRISIISTFYLIKINEFKWPLRISTLLVSDDHDLIHKAVGWMLREVGKRDLKQEEQFLKKHYKTMPRTMLRYAIEKFPENKRQKYLKGKI